MNRERFRFYLIRIKKASLAEWLGRAWEYLFLRLLKTAPVLALRPVRAPETGPSVWEQIRFPRLNGKIELETINRILSRAVFCLNQDQTGISGFERAWRKSFFSDIPTNQEDPDIRAVWEPARLQHLTLVLYSILENPDAPDTETKKPFVRTALLSWLAENPFLYGPHYISVMECGLRIPVFILSLKVLDTLSPSEQRAVVQAVFEHAWLTRKRLSLYSSLGNHTVAECVGLIMAGALFRGSRPGRAWLGLGVRLLEQECRRQILEDGGPAEQSLGYHRFVLDLYWFAVDFLEKNKLYDCSAWKVRLIKGEDFFEAFKSDGEKALSIGDSDDAHAVAPGLFPHRARPEKILSPEGGFSFKTFPQTGYTVIHGRNGLVMTFDHGPLGMAPLFNHGHADALSVTLQMGGRQFLVDPGTYRYNGRPRERAYFKGTRAHNTVTIDGADQARQLTGFIWEDTYTVTWSRAERQEGAMVLRAAHNGYSKLSKPVTHTRTLFFLDDNACVIKDTFQGRGRHDFELNFHLHPDAGAAGEGEWTKLSRGSASIFLRLLGSDFGVFQGRHDPFLGWFSSAYGLMQETTVLQARQNQLAAEASFTTIICFDKAKAGLGLERIALEL